MRLGVHTTHRGLFKQVPGVSSTWRLWHVVVPAEAFSWSAGLPNLAKAPYQQAPFLHCPRAYVVYGPDQVDIATLAAVLAHAIAEGQPWATPSRCRSAWRALTRAWRSASCSGEQTMLIVIVGCWLASVTADLAHSRR